MNRVEDLINSAKTNELLGELLHIKKEEEKKSNVLMWVAITLGAVLAVAGIAYAVYRFFTPDYLEDFDEDFDDALDFYHTPYPLQAQLFQKRQAIRLSSCSKYQ